MFLLSFNPLQSPKCTHISFLFRGVGVSARHSFPSHATKRIRLTLVNISINNNLVRQNDVQDAAVVVVVVAS